MAKISIKPSAPSSVLAQRILEEVRSLRKDLLFFLPQDDLNDYTSPQRIKRSYQKALKRYPPLASWK